MAGVENSSPWKNETQNTVFCPPLERNIYKILQQERDRERARRREMFSLGQLSQKIFYFRSIRVVWFELVSDSVSGGKRDDDAV